MKTVRFDYCIFLLHSWTRSKTIFLLPLCNFSCGFQAVFLFKLTKWEVKCIQQFVQKKENPIQACPKCIKTVQLRVRSHLFSALFQKWGEFGWHYYFYLFFPPSIWLTWMHLTLPYMTSRQQNLSMDKNKERPKSYKCNTKTIFMNTFILYLRCNEWNNTRQSTLQFVKALCEPKPPPKGCKNFTKSGSWFLS